MKGIIVSMLVIILTILILGMAAANIASSNTLLNKEKDIAFRKSEILRTKNALFLLNRSLETTWFMSSVQSIFKASGDFSADLCNGGSVNVNKLEELMKSKMSDYTTIPGTTEIIEVNDVDIQISDITPGFRFENDRVISSVRQTITASYADTYIITRTMNENSIQTYFKRMNDHSCSALQLARNISAEISTWSYCPGSCPCGCAAGCPSTSQVLANAEAEIQGRLNSRFSNLEDDLRFRFIKNQLTMPGSVLRYDYTLNFIEPAKYYYHDEVNNRFVKKDISISFDIEDRVQLKACACLSCDD